MTSSADPLPARMAAAEKSLARRLHFDQGKTRTDIAKLLQRSLSSVSRLLAQKKAPRSIGRPTTLSAATIERDAARLEKMVDEADGLREVTMAMLLRRGRFKVCEKTLATAMRARGYHCMGHAPEAHPDAGRHRRPRSGDRMGHPFARSLKWL